MSFDGQTELLVQNEFGASWEPISRCYVTNDAAKRLMVAQYKVDTGEVVWGELERLSRRHYDGIMVRLWHQHFDLFVTEQHLLLLGQKFEGRGSGTWDRPSGRVFGFWAAKLADSVSIPTKQMTLGVFPGQVNFKERQTHGLLSFQKSSAGSATLFPELVPGEDVEATSLHWSGPVYDLSVSHAVVRRNGKVCCV